MNDLEKKAAISNIAASVVHDIRSPIAAMEICLGLIATELSTDKVAIFKSAIQTTRDIANNLLAKYQSDTALACDYQNTSQSVLLSTLTEDITSQKRYEWLNKSVKLIVDFNSEIKSVYINVIPRDFKRVISNLLNNAIEACDEMAQIHLQVKQENGMIELRIIDNGVGMPAHKINLYLRGESSKHEGEGLGLSNAKRYFENMGGNLEINSRPGSGTTIIITFLKY